MSKPVVGDPKHDEALNSLTNEIKKVLVKDNTLFNNSNLKVIRNLTLMLGYAFVKAIYYALIRTIQSNGPLKAEIRALKKQTESLNQKILVLSGQVANLPNFVGQGKSVHQKNQDETRN